MRTSSIILCAMLVIMFEVFILKYQSLFIDIVKTVRMFDLNTIQYISVSPPAESAGVVGALISFFNIASWLAQLIWWLIRAGACFVYLMLILIVTFISLSMEFPILWFVNAPIVILLIYSAVSMIRLMGSGFGSGE